MKNFFVISLCLVLLTPEVSSQSKYGEDSVNCVINLSLYREYYKQKNYDDAINPWRWVYKNCPNSSGNIFKNGPILIKNLIKKDPENKSRYIDTLMMIYDRRVKFFGREGYVLGKKGADLIKYSPESFEEAFYILRKSVEMQKMKSEAGALLALFKSITLMEKNGKINKSEVLEYYSNLTDIWKIQACVAHHYHTGTTV